MSGINDFIDNEVMIKDVIFNYASIRCRSGASAWP